MAKAKRKDQIRAILCNYRDSRSIKATARQLKVSKNTVREYLCRCFEYSNDLTKILALGDAELEKLCIKATANEHNKPLAVFPCTQYCFCIALPSQSLPDFLEGREDWEPAG